MSRSSRPSTILFLSATPKDWNDLDVDQESKAIERAIGRGRNANKFDFRRIPAVSISELQETITRWNPQVVHFAGHGMKDGTLVFEDTAGQSEEARINAIANMFKILNGRANITNEKKIRCVVLNACYSKDLAHAIKKYVDCVVGMKNEILDRAAIIFAESFYFHLCDGESIKDAFEFARTQIQLLKDRIESGVINRNVSSIDSDKSTRTELQDIPDIDVRKGVDVSTIFLTGSYDNVQLSLVDLKNTLKRYFARKTDIKYLCSRLNVYNGLEDLSINSPEIASEDIQEMLFNVAKYCKDRDRIPELVEAAIAERPTVEEIRKLSERIARSQEAI